MENTQEVDRDEIKKALSEECEKFYSDEELIAALARVINLTPHPINICNNAGEVIKIYQPEGLVRLKTSIVNFGKLAGTTITQTVFGDPEGLPDYQENTYYIVSQLVKSALPLRSDLLVPAEVVRDDKGNIVGCKSLGI